MEASTRTVPCPVCGGKLRPALVKTDIWHGERLYVVEDVPAWICDACMEQVYDEAVTDALRRLNEDEFSSVEPKRQMLVPVFSLEGRVQRTVESDQPSELHERDLPDRTGD